MHVFFFSVLNNLQANYLLIVYISPSHSLMRATSWKENHYCVIMDQVMDASYPENATDSNNINSSYRNASSENFTDDAWASFSDSYHKEVRRVRLNFHSC